MRIMANSSGRSSGEATDGSRNCLSAASAQPAGTLEGDEPKSNAADTWALDHIMGMAERKRREEINQRFIELSAVRHPRRPQQGDSDGQGDDPFRRDPAPEAAAREGQGPGARGRGRRGQSRLPLVGSKEEEPAASRDPSTFLRDWRDDGEDLLRRHLARGRVAVRVLSEVEEGLHLRIIHANVMPFMASTVTITIATKVEEGFTVTAEDIVERLNSVLQRQNSCSSTEETGN